MCNAVVALFQVGKIRWDAHLLECLVIRKVPIMDPPSILQDNRVSLDQLPRSRTPTAKSVRSPAKAKSNIAHLRVANQSRDDEAE